MRKEELMLKAIKESMIALSKIKDSDHSFIKGMQIIFILTNLKIQLKLINGMLGIKSQIKKAKRKRVRMHKRTYKRKSVAK